ncbi:hypothetical protein Q4S45_07620 [Massilia sp. R2A-15]|uniref:hypothetical protein n=1 Tax=Massilia sp. R2A-15 TaxID=3064278 RepID=UPI002733177F|nr:hypothetical protein [Massilia sp. R2A-15]WLI90975.1 hypothetical protein Q4S45_07620 [Massilia sp. R2A-15]
MPKYPSHPFVAGVFMFCVMALGQAQGLGFGSPKSDDPIYRGDYFYNFENSILTPDGKSEAWCINSDMSKAMLPAKNPGEQWGTSYVVVRGKLGPEGSFGGLGRCKRLLEVTEILEVKNVRGRK